RTPTGVFSSIRALHSNLAMGKPGGVVNRVAAGVLLFLVVSGLYLWWPYKRWRIPAKDSLRRLSFDMHLSVGIYTFLFIGARPRGSFSPMASPLGESCLSSHGPITSRRAGTRRPQSNRESTR